MGHVIRFSACPPSGRRGPPPSLYKHAGGKKNKVNVTKALPAPAQGTDPGVHGTNVFTINSQAFLVMLLLLLRIVQVLDDTKWARTAAERTSQVCSLVCVPKAKPVSYLHSTSLCTKAFFSKIIGCTF